jgi:hypothetical protein
MVFQGQDAWRRHPMFVGIWKDPFPGIKKAAVIYGVYLGCEYTYRYLTAPEQPKQHAAHSPKAETASH